MNKMRWRFAKFINRLGWPMLASLAGLLVAIVHFLFVMSPVQKSLQNASVAYASAKLKMLTDITQKPQVIESPVSQLQTIIDNFPEIDSINDTWETIAKLSDDAGLTLDHTHYDASSSITAGLLSYRLNLPIKANYAQIKEFVANVMQSIPNVVLEQLSFKRDTVDSPIVEANITLVIYVRASQ